MNITTVAVMTTGDMGHALGRRLRENGLRVITSLRGRSARTAQLAAIAGIEDVPEDARLVEEADILLSVLAPAAAGAMAERVARAVESAGTGLLYVDCNAIAPQTVRGVAHRLESANVNVVDAGIIGGPPHPKGEPGGEGRIYASGEHADDFAHLRECGLDIRVIGSEIGQASGLKMCYAALTKGLTALGTELLTAGRLLGLEAALRAELESSQAALFRSLQHSIPAMPPKAGRWVGEMEEIAATFGALGLPPLFHQGAAELYRLVDSTSLGDETPELRHRGQTADDVVEILAETLATNSRSGATAN
jgi:3-hydroxyisobutyrate dehydrogenase-like beta-hydroxyacid dehydrogenase